MENTLRLFNCLRCRCQVFICSHCDRGNIYCGPSCAKAARLESLKKARERYQKSKRGAQKHALCQHRYRERKKEVVSKVMDQGSTPKPIYVPLTQESDNSMSCCFCGKHYSAFMRLNFLHSSIKHKNDAYLFESGP